MSTARSICAWCQTATSRFWSRRARTANSPCSATTHGFFAVQHTRGLLLRVSRSPAFAAPADISGMVQLASGDLLAVGVQRLGPMPATGSFRAAMWRSRDGITWQRVELEGDLAGASVFGSVATQGTIVVVTGQRYGTAVWRSESAGVSWAIASEDAWPPETVTHVSGRFVRFASPLPLKQPDIAFATSIDGREGRSSVASGLLDDGLGFFPRQVVTTASGVFLVGGAQLDLRRRLDWCYAAPIACTRGSGLVMLHTATGETWRAIDVALSLGPGLQTLAVTDTKAGTVIVGAAQRRVEIWTVPPASWSFVAPQAQPQLPRLPPLVPATGLIETGTVYRYPLGAHCGLEWLGQFNGRTWKVRSRLVGAPGNPQDV